MDGNLHCSRRYPPPDVKEEFIFRKGIQAFLSHICKIRVLDGWLYHFSVTIQASCKKSLYMPIHHELSKVLSCTQKLDKLSIHTFKTNIVCVFKSKYACDGKKETTIYMCFVLQTLHLDSTHTILGRFKYNYHPF